MIATCQFRSELFKGIDGGIDRPLNLLLNLLQTGENFFEFHLPHYHQVDVALCRLLTPCERPVHEGELDPVRQRLQRGAKKLEYANRFCQERLQFREDGALLVGVVKEPLADTMGNQQSEI